MAQVLRLSDHRPACRNRRVSFSRRELGLLLELYRRRVAAGEWRDYAIDHLAGMAVFSVFRHAHERPLFAIVKIAGTRGRPDEFTVFMGPRRVARAATLDEALRIFERRLRPIDSH